MGASSYRPWIAAALVAGCATRGGDAWVERARSQEAPGQSGWIDAESPGQRPGEATPEGAPLPRTEGADDEQPVLVREHGSGRPRAPQGEVPRGLFRNTYYDFPREGAGAKNAAVFDAACKTIEAVTQEFHDQVCVQGSGRLSSGATISFAKRDCQCAAICPRTAQRICFERLDPAKFPHGRGATGRAITPLRTVAVDSSVLSLGTLIYIPEFVGMPRPDGSPHDGCFVAEDRGLRVVGKQVDVFTGDPTLTARYNRLLPSNTGVHVLPGAGKCPR